MTLTWGNVPVPWTVSWTEEEPSYLASCPWAGNRMAICQPSKPGEGKPRFGKPHSCRQREAIDRGLCDLCGKPLAMSTKVSLSHARPRLNANLAILQVEPLLHRSCAAICIGHCPSLKRDVGDGALEVRQVFRHRVQLAIMSPVYVKTYVPDYQPRAYDRIIGHAKVELLEWRDRDPFWLIEDAGKEKAAVS